MVVVRRAVAQDVVVSGSVVRVDTVAKVITTVAASF